MDLILNRVAWMYYYGDMKQQEIADRLKLSRVTVNRLLKQAQKEGTVEIIIDPKHVKMFEYEDELKKKTGLDYVNVVPDTNDIEDSLCRGTAHLFNDILDTKGKLGIGLSETLKDLHKYIKEDKIDFEAVVSICGTAYPDLSMTPLNVGFTIADALKVSYYTIWAPVIVAEETNIELIKQDKYISKVLKMAAEVECAVVGIGDVDSSRLTEMGYIADEELQDVKSRGAIGEILGNYYDAKGRRIDSSITQRLVSVGFPMKCPVIGVAGGKNKIMPILGAVQSGFIQGLVVNDSVAEELNKLL